MQSEEIASKIFNTIDYNYSGFMVDFFLILKGLERIFKAYDYYQS